MSKELQTAINTYSEIIIRCISSVLFLVLCFLARELYTKVTNLEASIYELKTQLIIVQNSMMTEERVTDLVKKEILLDKASSK